MTFCFQTIDYLKVIVNFLQMGSNNKASSKVATLFTSMTALCNTFEMNKPFFVILVKSASSVKAFDAPSLAKVPDS